MGVSSVQDRVSNNGNSTPQKPASTFPAMLEAYKGEIARAIPRHMNADRLARIALTEFRKNPKLADCAPKSVFAAIIIASQLGLEPGLLGQAYLIPFKSECQLIPGYQGLIDLVRRTGKVKRIEAHVVREGDKFTYKTGLVTVLEHEPNFDGVEGPLILAYAVAEFTDGGYHVEVMSKHQIETIRDNSQGYKSAIQYKKDHPWISNTDEMWRKTLIRRICKYLPKSAELVTAIGLDDAAGNGYQGITIDSAVTGDWAGPVVDAPTDPPATDQKASPTPTQPEKDKAAVASEPTSSTLNPSAIQGIKMLWNETLKRFPADKHAEMGTALKEKFDFATWEEIDSQEKYEAILHEIEAIRKGASK